MNRRRILTTLSVLALSILIHGCGVFSTVDAPAEAARDWFEAVATMNALRADGLTCKTEREEFRENIETGSIFFRAAELLVGPLDVEVDSSDIEFKTVEMKGNWAIVSVQGEGRVAIGASVDSEEFDEEWYVVLEEEEWRWCGDVIDAESEVVTQKSDAEDIKEEPTAVRGEFPPIDSILLTLQNIETCRFETISEEMRNGEEYFRYSTIEGKYKRNVGYQYDEQLIEEDAELEWLFIQDTYCSREPGNDWSCLEDEDPVINSEELFHIYWSAIITGDSTAFFGNYEIMDKQVARDTLLGVDCIIFTLDLMSEGNKSQVSRKLCIDPVSYLPLLGVTEYRTLEGGKIIHVLRLEERYFDFNKPVEIELPRQ